MLEAILRAKSRDRENEFQGAIENSPSGNMGEDEVGVEAFEIRGDVSSQSMTRG